MGYSLSENHIILTEEQYKDLKEERYYIRSNFELELIDMIEAENARKATLFDALVEALVSQSIELSVGANLEEFIKDDLYEYIEEESYPLTLQEFLDYNYNGEWIENCLYKEKLGEQTFYILSQLRYW